MSSYYEPQGWQAPAAAPRQASWEQPVPPSRSGMASSLKNLSLERKTHNLVSLGSSSVSQREDSPAFSSQFDGMHTLSVKRSSFPRLFRPLCRPEKKNNIGLRAGRIPRNDEMVVSMRTPGNRRSMHRTRDYGMISGEIMLICFCRG